MLSLLYIFMSNPVRKLKLLNFKKGLVQPWEITSLKLLNKNHLISLQGEILGGLEALKQNQGIFNIYHSCLYSDINSFSSSPKVSGTFPELRFLQCISTQGSNPQEDKANYSLLTHQIWTANPVFIGIKPPVLPDYHLLQTTNNKEPVCSWKFSKKTGWIKLLLKALTQSVHSRQVQYTFMFPQGPITGPQSNHVFLLKVLKMHIEVLKQ